MLSKSYFTDLLILALPIFIGELGHILIGTTDILVVARYSIDSLAAVSIANSILFTIFIFGIGILIAISILLSNKRGARQGIKKYLLSSCVFSFLLAILFTIICYLTIFIVPKIGFEQSLIYLIQDYIKIASFSMFGIFFYEGIKQFLQSYEIVKFPNFLLLVSVFINLILDIVFVFGFGPIPAMGVKGSAIATLIVRTMMGFVMFAYIFRFINFKSIIDFSYMKQLIKIGYPIGIALLLEFLAFNIVTVLVGRISGVLAATHNILITISSATFMVPLSISVALSVKVAFYYGAKKLEQIKKYTIAALIIGVGFMAFASVLLILFPQQIISLFTSDKQVLEIALPLVLIVALYQVFDGFQIIISGVVKGFKMTNIVSISMLAGYWLVGMPVAVILVYKYNLLLKGYWIAIAFSLFVIGIVQYVIARLKYIEIKKSNFNVKNVSI